MKNIRTNKGITLIALVITIIVLLILAGVSIATLTGENGILTKANTAKDLTIEAEEKEQINLAYTTVMANKLHNGQEAVVTASELETQLNNQNAGATVEKDSNPIKVTFTKSKNVYTVDSRTGKITGTNEDQSRIPTIPMEEAKEKEVFEEKTEVKDTDNKDFIVPADFKIASDSADTVAEGVVIEDSTGNQFVWVPVDDINEFVRTAGYSNGSQQSLTIYTEPFANGYATEASDYEAMRKSVEDNHGFYIGRFEAGKDSSGNVVVKKEVDVYNSVPWGNAMNDIEGTSNIGGKEGAVKLAKEFASKNGYQGVTSILCYGVQWDATLKFIDPGFTGFAKDSRQQGWYSDNYSKTDSGNIETNPSHITGKDLIYSDKPTVIANKQKNVYDIAGNAIEWTMEASDTDRRVLRGGYYNDDGSDSPASRRNNGYLDNDFHYVGFRVALYL